MSLKRCSKCKITKDRPFFNKNKAWKDGLSYECKSCESARARLYRKLNPAKSRESVKKWQIKNKDKNKDYIRKALYGIEFGTYKKMFDSQDGQCAICKKYEKLCIDHDHKDFSLRSLLCIRCNSILGFAKEDKKILLNAVLYLEKWSKSNEDPNAPM